MYHDSLTYVPWLIDMRAMTNTHVPWVNDWPPKYICAQLYMYLCHHPSICLSWHIGLRAMTHWYTCHESWICVPWLIDVCAMIHSNNVPWRSISVQNINDRPLKYIRAQLYRYIWLINVCTMTHWCMCHDSLNDRPLKYIRAHLYGCMCHDLLMYVPWFLDTSAMTHW